MENQTKTPDILQQAIDNQKAVCQQKHQEWESYYFKSTKKYSEFTSEVIKLRDMQTEYFSLTSNE